MNTAASPNTSAKMTEYAPAGGIDRIASRTVCSTNPD
jgi:hypothetical protein